MRGPEDIRKELAQMHEARVSSFAAIDRLQRAGDEKGWRRRYRLYQQFAAKEEELRQELAAAEEMATWRMEA